MRAVLAAVRNDLVVQRSDVKFLGNNPAIQRGRAGVARSDDEAREQMAARKKRKILPAFVEMLTEWRRASWDDQPWDTREGRLNRAAYLGFMVMCNEGPRISNVTPAEGKGKEAKRNHNCKGRDLVFESIHGVRAHVGQPALAAMVLESQSVASANISYITTKVRKQQQVQENKIIARRTEEESRLLDDLVEWARRAEIGEDEKLFTIKMDGQSRLMRYSDVASAVKQAAVRCGLPPQHFSTSSARRFFATQMDLAGVSKAERNAVGGWSQTSSVADGHYSREGALRGAFAVLGAQRLSLTDVQRLVPFV